MKLEDSDIKKIVPDANLGLIIEGLAFMYMKGDLLMMRFPEAEDHTLKITIERNAHPYAEFSVPVGSFIEITHNGAMTPKKNDFEGVLDINTLHPGLKLKQGSELKTSSRGLSIANAHVEPYGIPTKFEFWEITKEENGEQTAKYRRKKEEIKAVMIGEVIIGTETAEPRTIIKVEGEIPFEVNLTYSENTKYMLIISNHCNKSDCEFRSDFHHYYEIFDPSSITNKFDLVLSTTETDKTDSDSLPIIGNRAPCNIIYSASNPE